MFRWLSAVDSSKLVYLDAFNPQHTTHLHTSTLAQFVGSVNRVNYNQNNDLNSLAGLVSLCPTVTGAVVSVREGNARMAEALLQAAQANLRPNVSVGWVHG